MSNLLTWRSWGVYAVASHEGAIHMVWLHFREAVMSAIFIYGLWTSEETNQQISIPIPKVKSLA